MKRNIVVTVVLFSVAMVFSLALMFVGVESERNRIVKLMSLFSFVAKPLAWLAILIHLYFYIKTPKAKKQNRLIHLRIFWVYLAIYLALILALSCIGYGKLVHLFFPLL